jgi:hypothetical protein
MSAAPPIGDHASPARTAAAVVLAAALLGGYILLLDYVFPNGVIVIAIVVVAAVFALDGRRQLTLLARLFITGVFFDFAYGMCLIGRTSQPGLNGDAIGTAFIFFLVSAFPFPTLFCLWPRKIATALVIAAFPVSLALASLVAGFEEQQFVKLHRASGIGPTARWTISQHWLSYDAQEQVLYGSD